MHQPTTRDKAISLRKQGYSYNHISKIISVPKATLSDWLCRLPYIPNKYTIDTIGKARAAAGLKKSQLKKESLNNAVLQAEKDIGNLSKRDLFMLGLGIYIGEGAKSYDITQVANANPAIIRLSVKWFMEICGVKLENFR